MARNPFVGTWRLVSFEVRSEDGRVSYPYGQDSLGYIMYSADGYMAVVLAGRDRPRFASGDVLGGTDEEKVAAAESFTSYSGRYEIRGESVIHHIEVSFFPNWIGVDQERFFEFGQGTLSLSTPPLLLSGVQATAHLIWERV